VARQRNGGCPDLIPRYSAFDVGQPRQNRVTAGDRDVGSIWLVRWSLTGTLGIILNIVITGHA
jgi:hypothetical protein